MNGHSSSEDATFEVPGGHEIPQSEDLLEKNRPSSTTSAGPGSSKGFGDAQNNTINFGMNNNGMPNMMNMGMGMGNNMDYNQMMQFMSNPMMHGPGMNSMMGMFSVREMLDLILTLYRNAWYWHESSTGHVWWI